MSEMRAEPGCGELLDTQLDDWGMQSAVGRGSNQYADHLPPLRLNYSLGSGQNRMSTSIKGPLLAASPVSMIMLGAPRNYPEGGEIAQPITWLSVPHTNRTHVTVTHSTTTTSHPAATNPRTHSCNIK